jgi:mercuric ion binding protein
MKNIFIFLSLFIIVTAFTSGIYAENAVKKTVKFKCEEMTCSGCKSKITSSVKSLKGIKAIDIDLETKMVVVTYDDKKTTTDAIKTAIAEAGYEAVMVE